MRSLKGGKIILFSEEGTGKIFSTEQKCFRFGSCSTCDYVLENPKAKEIHCEIKRDASGRIKICNLSEKHPVSLNGLIVRGTKLLLNGNVIKIFDEIFRWEYEPDRRSVEVKDNDQMKTPENCRPTEQALNSERNVKKHSIRKRITLCKTSNFDDEMRQAGIDSNNQSFDDGKNLSEVDNKTNQSKNVVEGSSIDSGLTVTNLYKVKNTENALKLISANTDIKDRSKLFLFEGTKIQSASKRNEDLSESLRQSNLARNTNLRRSTRLSRVNSIFTTPARQTAFGSSRIEANLANNNQADRSFKKVMVPGKPVDKYIQENINRSQKVADTLKICDINEGVKFLEDIFGLSPVKTKSCYKDSETNAKIDNESNADGQNLTLDENFDKLIGKSIVKRNYSRPKRSHNIIPLPIAKESSFQDVMKLDIQKWLNEVIITENSEERLNDSFLEHEEHANDNFQDLSTSHISTIDILSDTIGETDQALFIGCNSQSIQNESNINKGSSEKVKINTTLNHNFDHNSFNQLNYAEEKMGLRRRSTLKKSNESLT